jgi:hypothetical protein
MYLPNLVAASRAHDVDVRVENATSSGEMLRVPPCTTFGNKSFTRFLTRQDLFESRMEAIHTAFGHDTTLCDRILAAASRFPHPHS